MTKVRIATKLTNEGYRIIRHGTEYGKSDLDYVPKRAGIYALFHGDTLQYIGKSNDLSRRLKEWRFKSEIRDEYVPFGNCQWFILRENQVSNAENVLICYYEPPYNVLRPCK